MIKKIKLNKNDFYAGIGWLARENKINKTKTKYQLDETNLTEHIGTKAGKIWDIINSTQDVDISTIAEISQIKIRDIYYALGWLAREDKIQASPDQVTKYKLK